MEIFGHISTVHVHSGVQFEKKFSLKKPILSYNKDIFVTSHVNKNFSGFLFILAHYASCVDELKS